MPIYQFPHVQQSHDGREQQVHSYILSQPSLKGNPSAILAAMDEFSGQKEFLISLGENKAKILTEMIIAEKPKEFVEVGGYVGYSAILVGDTMRSYDTKAQVWSLELEKQFATIIEELVEFAGLSDVVKVVVGPASDSLRAMKADGRIDQPDFYLIDHVEELYVSEFRTIESLGCLKVGAVIVADNVVRPGAPKYREFVRHHDRLRSEGVPCLITPGGLEVCLELVESFQY